MLMARAHLNIYFVPSFYVRQKYITRNSYVNIIRHIFQTKVINFSILFTWIKMTYIILNLYRNTL